MKGMLKFSKAFVFLFFFLVHTPAISNENEAGNQKVLICGICRNVSFAIPNTIKSIETLGSCFADYAVIIYENNSSDSTAPLLTQWACSNARVNFVSEIIPTEQLAPARTIRIANARNIVLQLAQDPKYCDFKYLIMADLDFKEAWPVDEIVKTIESEIDWDCVSANGIYPNGDYLDRYAFRDKQFPLGPELIQHGFWNDVCQKPVKITGKDWASVYSAFGGLAIYKTASIINFSYSGIVTKGLEEFYKIIILSLPVNHHHLKLYLKQNHLNSTNDLLSIPLNFQWNSMWDNNPAYYKDVTCCEHVTLHAAMFLHGFDKFYINPKMIMRY